MKKALVDLVSDALGPDYDVDTSRPNTTRGIKDYVLFPMAICSNLSKRANSGHHRPHRDPTERGLRLASGEELEADIIVTATGLNMQVMGGAHSQWMGD